MAGLERLSDISGHSLAGGDAAATRLISGRPGRLDAIPKAVVVNRDRKA